MVLCLLLLPGMAGAGTGADSTGKKNGIGSEQQTKRTTENNPGGYSKVYLGTPFVRMRGES